MCDLEVIVVPSIFKLMWNVVPLVGMFPTLDLICEENTVRRLWNWLDYTI